MKIIHFMLTLLIQKPSKNSKAKDHLKALERRMKLSKKKGVFLPVDTGRERKWCITFINQKPE